MKKLFIRLLLVAIVLVVLALGVGIFFLGSIVKAGVEKVGPSVTGVPVKLDSATVSLFGGSGTLKGFVVGNPEGFQSTEAIKVGTVTLSVVPKSVFSDKVIIHSIRVEAPEISYELSLKGSNLGKILDNVSRGANKPAGETKPPGQPTDKKSSDAGKKLQVDEFVITGAKMHFGATGFGSAPVIIPEIRLINLGQGPDGITPAELTQLVISALKDAAAKAAAENPGKLGGAATDALKKGATGLGDLLKKK